MRLVTLGIPRTPELRAIADWLGSLQAPQSRPARAATGSVQGTNESLRITAVPAWQMAISHGNTPASAQSDDEQIGATLFQIGSGDLLVVWQDHPDGCSSADVNCLLSMAVLARVIVVNGPWCEAAIRTRSVWPAALQVPFWNARVLIERELVWRSTHASSRVPHTITRDELWSRLCSTAVEFRQQVSLNHSSADQRLIISSLHLELSQLWQAVAIMSGWPTQLIFRTQSVPERELFEPDLHPTTVLFDADPWPERQPELLHWVRAGATVIAVLSWPTEQTCAALKAAGASAIQSKLTFAPEMLLPPQLASPTVC